MESDKSLGRQASADQALTLSREELDQFETLFLNWKGRYPNVELLEVGASGDLEALARECLEWARGVLSPAL